MSDIKVDDRPEPPLEGEVVTGTAETLAQEAQPAKPPVSAAKVAQEKWTAFETEVNARADNIATMLPSTVSRDRFINSTIAAVKQNPDLLFVPQRTLFAAIVKSAQDGLVPDGREGYIGIYNTNVAKRGEPHRYEDVAQWQPMVHGIRKRARECGGMLIDAQVVYMQDHFLWDQGDEPKIEHTPAKLGTPRGAPIGAYAIFKQADGTILHREVMDSEAINDVKSQSKAQQSLMWTKFWTEGWRKSVIRRGVKSVPSVDAKLAQVIMRDDENFDFGNPEPTRFIEHQPKDQQQQSPRQDGRKAPFRRQALPSDAKPAAEQASSQPQDTQEAGSVDTVQDADFTDETPMERGKRLLALCKSVNDVADLRASIAEELARDETMLGAWNAACDMRSRALTTVGPLT